MHLVLNIHFHFSGFGKHLKTSFLNQTIQLYLLRKINIHLYIKSTCTSGTFYSEGSERTVTTPTKQKSYANSSRLLIYVQKKLFMSVCYVSTSCTTRGRGGGRGERGGGGLYSERRLPVASQQTGSLRFHRNTNGPDEPRASPAFIILTAAVRLLTLGLNLVCVFLLKGQRGVKTPFPTNKCHRNVECHRCRS